MATGSVAELHQPARTSADPAGLFLDYLDYYRAVVARKIEHLPDADLRTSRLPSGWSPLELVKHLVYMERRWLRWGYLAEPVADPFGDQVAEDVWGLQPDDTAESLVAALLDGGRRTREIVAAASLESVAPIGGRFQPGDKHPPPTLLWILMHVFEEYARHAGHLDIARELIDGEIGEN
jgi:uncharacterized damage-inducible protein DinB